MARIEGAHEENIVRAIHEAWWDTETGRKSSQIFKGQNISVSRLSILSLDELFSVFHKELDTSPNGRIVGGGEINVGVLILIGQNYSSPQVLSVEEDPLPSNPAHAEIPQKISRGLANEIIKNLRFHLSSSKYTNLIV